jgi:hypothetical protein
VIRSSQNFLLFIVIFRGYRCLASRALLNYDDVRCWKFTSHVRHNATTDSWGLGRVFFNITRTFLSSGLFMMSASRLQIFE